MKKILIIEDEQSIREVFYEIFVSGGYDVAASPDGKNGIKLAKSYKPDLIICDLMMPEVDGFEVKRILRLDKDTACIPFIYLTARTDIQDVRKAMELGADDYITKPIGAKKLLELISNRLQRIEELNAYEIKDHSKNDARVETDKILLKTRDRHILTLVDDIILIKAAGDYSEVILKSGEKVLKKKSLKNWEERLPENTFLRIHRNTILNLTQIESIEPMFNGSFMAKLKDYKEPIYFSQRYSQKIRKLLS